MKLSQILIGFISSFIVFSSCNNDLMENIYHDVAEETYNYNNVYEALGSVYQPLRELFDHHSYYMTNESSSDAIVMPANGSGWSDGGIYLQMHLHTWTTETPQMAFMWESFYRGVLRTNALLQLLENDKLPIPSETNSEELISEAKVVRALYYWLILDNFGVAPLVVTTSDIADSLPDLMSRVEIFNFVKDEIESSIPHLSEETNQLLYGRFNKWAAEALLANLYLNSNVYINKEAWSECLNLCEDIINSGRFSLEDNYKDLFNHNNSESSEIIFAIPFDENFGTGFFPEMFSWHAALRDKFEMQVTPWGSGSAMGIPQFIDTYDEDDQRLYDTWLMGPQFSADGITPLLGAYDISGQQLDFVNKLPDGQYTSETEGYRMNKFEVLPGSRDNLNDDFPFFRYAEILFMKAECLLRDPSLGSESEAAHLVTEIRKRSFKETPQKANRSVSDLKGNSVYNYGYVEDYQIVDLGDQSPIELGGLLDDLGWEFAWEAHRRRDDIRFGVYTTKSWLSHKPNGDDRSMFMIPQSAINSNPKLKK